MRIHRILCLGAALVIPQLALGKLPFTNDAFGKVEGTIDFCAQMDAQEAPKYQERTKMLVRGLPEKEKEVVEARQTKAYADAYDWISAELGKLPKEKVVEACTAYLEGDKDK